MAMQVKQFFTDGLLQIATVLSILRLDLHSYPNLQNYMYIESGYSDTLNNVEEQSDVIFAHQPQYHIRPSSYFVHTKYFEPRHVVENLTILGLYDSIPYPSTRNFQAFLLAEENEVQHPHTSDNNNNNAQNSATQVNTDTRRYNHSAGRLDSNVTDYARGYEENWQTVFPNSDLTKEDMDLIDVLWKQDIDLGACREMFDPVLRTAEKEKNKADKEKLEEKEADQNDPWNGLQYYIDGETGEHIVQKGNDNVSPSAAEPSSSELHLTDAELSVHLDDISQVLDTVSEGFQPPREEGALQPERLRQDSESTHVSEVSYQSDETEVFQGFRLNEINLQPVEGTASHIADDNAPEQFDSYLHLFMQQQAHSNDDETTPSYIRLTSMEQRWQDVSNLLQLEEHNDELDDTLHLNASSTAYAAMPESEIRAEDVLLRNVSMVPANLFNYTELRAQLATNASQHGDGDNSDAMDLDANNFFFPNDTSSQAGGFLQKFLKEEHLDDLAIDIPVDGENMSSVISSGSVDRGSDSALSSFGGSSYSASLEADANGGGSNISDDGYSAGDFNDDDSMEGATGGDSSDIWRYHESHYNLLGDRQIAGAIGPFGVERLQHGVAHNHTYEGRTEKPRDVGRSKIIARDKKFSPGEQRQLSRDHRRAREMSIPFSVEKIINLPIEPFTKLLQEHSELNDAQLTLIRDIRRRGKNKMAAQNCRKRKLGTIVNLEGEVSHLEKIKADLLKENLQMSLKVENIKNKFGSLYKQVFESLRDPSGNPYDPARYSLQQTTSGSIFLVPVNSTAEDNTAHNGARRKKRPRE